MPAIFTKGIYGGGINSLDVSTFATGVYFIKVESGKSVAVQKLIKNLIKP